MKRQTKSGGGTFGKMFLLSLLLYLAGIAADNLTTWYALSNYPESLHESNPKTAALLERYGLPRGLLMDDLFAVQSDVMYILAASIAGTLVVGLLTNIFSKTDFFILFISLGFLGVGLLTLFQGGKNALLIMSLN